MNIITSTFIVMFRLVMLEDRRERERGMGVVIFAYFRAGSCDEIVFKQAEQFSRNGSQLPEFPLRIFVCIRNGEP